MNAPTELIRITARPDGQHAVSARELHGFLEIRRDFTTWCKQMFEYGFVEGQDFTPILVKSTGGRPSQDYALTVECAKEIAMIQRTERGKQARQYFLEVERRYGAMLRQPALALQDWMSSPAAFLRALADLWERQPMLPPAPVPAPAPAPVAPAERLYDMAEVAKVLRFRGVGRTRLFEVLREQRVLQANNQPYQRVVDAGHFATIESTWTDEHGEPHLYLKTVATRTGLAFIRDLLTRLGFEPMQGEAAPPPAAAVQVETPANRFLVVDCKTPPPSTGLLEFRWGNGKPERATPGLAKSRLDGRLKDLISLKKQPIKETNTYRRAVGYYTGLSRYYGRRVQPKDFKWLPGAPRHDLLDMVAQDCEV